MKKPVGATRVVPQAARGPLFSLATAWRAAEDLGGRPTDPAPSNRLAWGAGGGRQRPNGKTVNR
jgi:hypothetical protein